MCGGFVGQVIHNPVKAVSKLAQPKTYAKIIHNPADALLGNNIQKSSIYRNIGRPIAKIGEGALAGGLVGGIPGAIIGGTASAIGGGLTNNPSRPLPNLIGPGLAAYALTNPVQTFAQGVQSGTAQGLPLSTTLGQSALGAYEALPSLGGLSGLASLGQAGLSLAGGLTGGGGGVAPQLYAPPTPFASLSQAGLLGSQQGGGNNQGQNNQQVNDALGRADSLRRGVAV